MTTKGQRQEGKKPTPIYRRSLMDESISISLFLSVLIIFIVQLASLFILISVSRSNIIEQSIKTADELGIILIEPLYNVDDAQAVRICEALISSGRIAGIELTSSASGLIFEKKADPPPRWLESQSRQVEYRGIKLGSIVVEYSEIEFIDTVRVFIIITITLITAVLLFNMIVNFFFLRKRMRSVFTTIEMGIFQFRSGNYEYVIPECSYEDMDVIIDLLNDMSDDIHKQSSELKVLNADLETQVAKRTAELERTLEEQRRLQEKLIESEKLSVLGRLSAGIAHEFNTPLAAIISSVNILRAYLDGPFLRKPAFYMNLTEEERNLYMLLLEMGFRENNSLNLPLHTRGEKKQARQMLRQQEVQNAEDVVEILSDLGLLGKLESLSPLFNLDHFFEILKEASEAIIVRRMTQIIEESSKKASNVIYSLRSYLASNKTENQLIHLDDAVRRVLTLMHNILKRGIQVEAELAPLQVRGVADRIDQVLLNIIRNATQAMESKGKLVIKTDIHDNMARVIIRDSGPGIPPEIQDRIFEPFFTTRVQGAGMGLGLDICKRIIEEEGGTIGFSSKPGKTEFYFTLPLMKLEPDEEA